MIILLLLSLFFTNVEAAQLSSRVSNIKLMAHFNEGTGTETVDSSTGKQGILVAGASWVTGRYSNALSFNGSNGTYMYFDTDQPFSALTVSAWIKPNTIAAGNYSVVHHPYDPTGWVSPYVLYDLRYTGTGIYYQVTTQDIVAYTANPSYTFKVGSWYHLAITWVQGGLGILYINGVKVSQIGPYTSNYPIVDSMSPSLRVGGLNNVNCCSFNGVVDEVFVVEKQYAAAEIKNTYLLGLGRHSNDNN